MVSRLTLAFSVCALLVLLFLHNPIGGWTYSRTYKPGFGEDTRSCTADEKREWRQLYVDTRHIFKFTDAQIEEKAALCVASNVETELLPLSEWKSNAPHAPWFGSVANVLSAVATIGLMCASVVIILRPRGRATKGPAPPQ